MKEKNLNQQFKKTELVWPNKRTEVEHVELPFQTIETINLPRGSRQDGLFGDRAPQDWRNRLIWGDNLLVMGSLLKEFAGKINLIYIDPPFATGDDFSFQIKIGDEELTKEPSALEVKAYRDTWGKGLESYLQMMYDRLVLMKELLADDGSIYVHLDWHVGHYIKMIMDEIFGKENFRNDIIWRKRNIPNAQAKFFSQIYDNILFYTKTENYKFNKVYTALNEQQKGPYRFKDKRGLFRLIMLEARGIQASTKRKTFEWRGKTAQWLYSKERLNGFYKNGYIYGDAKTGYSKKQYLDEIEGILATNIWSDKDVSPIQGGSKEYIGYSTQKPQGLLERIAKVSSGEGDIIADFFCGSGTTGAAAERLNRRWIMSDLGRFAINISRKRLLSMPSCKPFIVQNLGKYERHRWVHKNGTLKDYIKFILELYHAEPVESFENLHGKKGNVFVRVGAVDAPVTLSEITDALEECKKNKIRELDILGWEWEMGLHDLVKDEAKKYGVKLKTLQIPREVMELNIKDKKTKEEVQFYELAYLDVNVKKNGNRVIVELKDFIIPNPELLSDEVKDKVKNWSDYIDYWAVDWMFNQHPDKKTEEDSSSAKATADRDTFHNMNQRYRTRKEPKLELLMDYTYKQEGQYNILVKVIDIFGNDTTKLVEVKI